jgi:hypothetical protein
MSEAKVEGESLLDVAVERLVIAVNQPDQHGPLMHRKDVKRVLMALAESQRRVAALEGAQGERVAQLVAHRACLGTEHDPASGKIHGYCVVCGVPWPCDIAKPVVASTPTAPAAPQGGGEG